MIALGGTGDDRQALGFGHLTQDGLHLNGTPVEGLGSSFGARGQVPRDRASVDAVVQRTPAALSGLSIKLIHGGELPVLTHVIGLALGLWQLDLG
ncbi:hypothetical protein D3C72_1331090 [compost metagenome]